MPGRRNSARDAPTEEPAVHATAVILRIVTAPAAAAADIHAVEDLLNARDLGAFAIH
jgi:hypothetical protein